MLLSSHRSPSVLEDLPPQASSTVPRSAPVRPTEVNRPAIRGSVRYDGIPPAAKISWLAILVSVGFHAGLLFGFNHHAAVKKAVMVAEAPTEMLMMPDLKEDEENLPPKELNDDTPPDTPSVQVPQLADVPVLMPEATSFTQLADLTRPDRLEGAARNVMAIPLNIQHGRPDASKISDLFNIADLDRVPEPIVRTPPTFPYALKRDYASARVKVGFIVTVKGEVIMAYIISSPNPGFDRPTLEAVEKWKFRPGMKGGRKVNTRVEQPIDFRVMDDNE